MNKKSVYIKAILVPLILGGIVGFVISNFIDYNNLNRPKLAPPSIIFPIIWTILYILMGISYGILKNRKIADKRVNIIYYTQLIINLLWPIFFFALKWRLFSFIWIILLDVAIILMIIEFYKKNKISAFLQIPYLVWSIVATYLNFGVYILNK